MSAGEARLCPSCWNGALLSEPDGMVDCTYGCGNAAIVDALLAAIPQPGLNGAQLTTRRASEIPVERVRFLVPERVPLGAVTLLAGDPGLGKSTLTALWAAGVTTGEYGGEPAAVLIANAEDAAGAVMVPRLAAAGADLDAVELFAVSEDGQERGFTIPDDVPSLEAHAAEIEAKLVIVDPLAAHLSDGTNTHRDHSTRRAMAPLVAMAERLGCAVLVVAHLNKATGADALYRVGGTIGMTGGPRSVLLFARDPDDPECEQGARRALAHAKGNWAKLAPTLVYEHEAVEYTTRDGLTVETHRLVFGGESEADSTALLAPNRDDPPASQRQRAGELLSDLLGDGDWHRTKEIEAVAARDGIARRTLYRAVTDAGVESRRDGFPAVAYWRLPASCAKARGTTAGTTGVAQLEIPDGKGDSDASAVQVCQCPERGTTGVCDTCGGVLTTTPKGPVCIGCFSRREGESPTAEQASRNGHATSKRAQ